MDYNTDTYIDTSYFNEDNEYITDIIDNESTDNLIGGFSFFSSSPSNLETNLEKSFNADVKWIKKVSETIRKILDKINIDKTKPKDTARLSNQEDSRSLSVIESQMSPWERYIAHNKDIQKHVEQLVKDAN
jgi:hypothetical protein